MQMVLIQLGESVVASGEEKYEIKAASKTRQFLPVQLKSKAFLSWTEDSLQGQTVSVD